MSNPLLGVVYHWLGGLASASFYIPYRGVNKWSWETYWLVRGTFSWIIAPTTLALFLVPDLYQTIHSAQSRSGAWCPPDPARDSGERQMGGWSQSSSAEMSIARRYNLAS